MSEQKVSPFPRRGELINATLDLLRDVRSPRTRDVPVTRIAGYDYSLTLDEQGNEIFQRLVVKLVVDQHFEHLSQQEIEEAIARLVEDLQTAERRNMKEAAHTFIDELAREPLRERVLVGVRHLILPETIDLQLARFLTTDEASFLQPVLGDRMFAESGTYCEVYAAGGTAEKIVDRAQHQAGLAVAFLRLHLRHELRMVPSIQLQFALHMTYVREDNDGHFTRHIRRPHPPIPLVLPPDEMSWTTVVGAEGAAITALPVPFRERVETALEWMGRATSTTDWKIKILTTFSAMEALLVPEASYGSKAELVTVRGMALQNAVEGQFTDPAATYNAYIMRCNLVHGTPINREWTKERIRRAENLEWWAKRIVSAYVTYAGQSTAKTAAHLSRELDRSAAARQARGWLKRVEAEELVREYGRVVQLPEDELFPATEASGVT